MTFTIDLNIILTSIALLLTLWMFFINKKSTDHNQFEQTFFNLLAYHNNVKVGLSDPDSDEKPNFDEIYDSLESQFGLDGEEFNKPVADYLDKMKTWYFNSYNRKLTPYISSLYVVLNYVDKSDLIREKQKDFYFKTLVGQMTPKEKIILFYHLSLYKGSPESNEFDSGLAEIESRRKLLSTIKEGWALFFEASLDRNLLIYSGIYPKTMMQPDNWFTPPEKK